MKTVKWLINMKSGSTSFVVIKEMLIKTTMTKATWWEDVEQMGCLFTAGECKLLQPLWNTAWQHTEVEDAIPLGQALPLYTYSLDAWAHTHTLRDMHRNIHSKIIWQGPKAATNPNVQQQNGQAQCYMATLEYYSARKKEWTTTIHHYTDEPHRHNKQNKPNRKDYILNNSI